MRDDPVRIAMLIDYMGGVGAEGGGAERIAHSLTLALHERGVDVRAWVTRSEEDSNTESLRSAGVPVVLMGRGSPSRNPVRRARDLEVFARLGKELRAHEIDILHAHKFGSNAWASLIGPGARIPVTIATEQTWTYEGNPLRTFIDGRVIGRLADAFVAVSDVDARNMRTVEKVPASKIRVIPNGLTPAFRLASGEGRRVREELGVPIDGPVVGTLASLRPQKALDLLIRAFARARATIPDAHLVIAGGGPERPALEREAQRRGVSSCVTFAGWRDDIAAVLDSFDVFAMTSNFEGTPLALIEAMAAGTPSVASAVGGVPEVLDGGRCGILFQRGDEDALTEGLVKMLTESAATEAMVARARARVDERYSFDGMVERWIALYRELHGRSGRRTGRVLPAAGAPAGLRGAVR